MPQWAPIKRKEYVVQTLSWEEIQAQQWDVMGCWRLKKRIDKNDQIVDF